MELNAITLTTTNMAASVAFWQVLGLETTFGGPTSAFTTLRLGPHFINLTTEATPGPPASWGRVIIHVESPDDVHDRYRAAGYRPETGPADAPWGERYFHIRDPDGHEISFAVPLAPARGDGGPTGDRPGDRREVVQGEEQDP